MKEDMIKSFNRIALLDDRWDHNRNYAKLLLCEIGTSGGKAIDIGCGTGEFTKRLSEDVTEVTGIDISPVMIQEAIKRNSGENIRYKIVDFDEFEENIKYDYIVSIATFHHLDLETALPKIKRILRPGGKLMVLDLYERRGLADKTLDILATPMNFLVKNFKNGWSKSGSEESEAWKEHSHLDQFMTFSELKAMYSKHLSPNIRLKRLLFWRYVMVYTKKENI